MTVANDRDAGSLARPSEPAAGQGADALSAVLRGVRLTGAVFFVVDASSPWCIDVPQARAYARIILPRAQHVLSYHVVVEGGGWAAIPGAEPLRFEAGDVLVFPHGDPYVMRSAPDVPPELDREQTLAFFRALAAGTLPFVVTEGGGRPPPAKFICGFLGCDLRPFNPVLAGLPRLLRLRRADREAGGLLDRLVELTLAEAQAGGAGGESVRLRLSELLFIELLRRYAATARPQPPGWLVALQDPRIARALEAMHEAPERDWSVAGLARVAGLSRSVLAERFARLLGHPPGRYLALWRMQLASQLLLESALPVAEVGRSVGYASEAAFSRSFKRLAGASPEAWRQRAGAG